jgi:hypothetical protein
MIDFLVKDPLPNVTFPLERSFAGNLPVNRPYHPNDTLFFWGFEKTNGSLTRDANDNSDESVFAFPSCSVLGVALLLTLFVYYPVLG